MKEYFDVEVKGKAFFKTYISFFIPIVVLYIIATTLDDSRPVLSTVFSLAQGYLSALLGFAFFCFIIKTVSIKDEGFVFTGSLGEFAPKILKWYLLTVITLGIYSPWYLKNMLDYYFGRLSFRDKNGEFQSRPGTLLKYMLLTLYIPLAAAMLIYIFFVVRNASYGSEYQLAVMTFLFVFFVFLIMIPFLFFYFVWLVNVNYSDYRIRFTENIARTSAMLIGQILLCLITAGIYYPAACVKIYRFIANGTVLTDRYDRSAGSFGFTGTAGRGFLLLWGQALLTVITVGIYGPWAMSKVSKWFIENTCVDMEAVQSV